MTAFEQLFLELVGLIVLLALLKYWAIPFATRRKSKRIKGPERIARRLVHINLLIQFALLPIFVAANLLLGISVWLVCIAWAVATLPVEGRIEGQLIRRYRLKGLLKPSVGEGVVPADYVLLRLAHMTDSRKSLAQPPTCTPVIWTFRPGEVYPLLAHIPFEDFLIKDGTSRDVTAKRSVLSRQSKRWRVSSKRGRAHLKKLQTA